MVTLRPLASVNTERVRWTLQLMAPLHHRHPSDVRLTSKRSKLRRASGIPGGDRCRFQILRCGAAQVLELKPYAGIWLFQPATGAVVCGIRSSTLVVSSWNWMCKSDAPP
jgi:hypothetical protein